MNYFGNASQKSRACVCWSTLGSWKWIHLKNTQCTWSSRRRDGRLKSLRCFRGWKLQLIFKIGLTNVNMTILVIKNNPMKRKRTKMQENFFYFAYPHSKWQKIPLLFSCIMNQFWNEANQSSPKSSSFTLNFFFFCNKKRKKRRCLESQGNTNY